MCVLPSGPPLSPSKRSRPTTPGSGPNSAGNTPVKGSGQTTGLIAAAVKPKPPPPKRTRKPKRVKPPPTDSTAPSTARSSGPSPHFSVLQGPLNSSSHNPVPLGLLSISAPLPQAALVAGTTSPGSPPPLPIRVTPHLGSGGGGGFSTSSSNPSATPPLTPILNSSPAAGLLLYAVPAVPPTTLAAALLPPTAPAAALPPPSPAAAQQRGRVQFASPAVTTANNPRSRLTGPPPPRVIQYAPKQQAPANRMPGPAHFNRPGTQYHAKQPYFLHYDLPKFFLASSLYGSMLISTGTSFLLLFCLKFLFLNHKIKAVLGILIWIFQVEQDPN